MSDFLNWRLTNKLHNLGYDGQTLMYIDDENDIINDDSATLIGAVPAILKSAAFRWFRNKYGYLHYITYWDPVKAQLLGEADYQGAIIFPHQHVYRLDKTHYATYEETEEACIEKLVTLVWST